MAAVKTMIWVRVMYFYNFVISVCILTEREENRKVENILVEYKEFSGKKERQRKRGRERKKEKKKER